MVSREQNGILLPSHILLYLVGMTKFSMQLIETSDLAGR